MPVMMLDKAGNRPARKFGRFFLGHNWENPAATIRGVAAIANSKLARTA
jgi:hypothetical protein